MMNDFIATIIVHSIIWAGHRLSEIGLGQVRALHAGDKDSPGSEILFNCIWCDLIHSSLMSNPAVFATPFSRSVRSLFD